ncbi:MAG TPA: hypothetical protein VHO25_18780 [Polyangiaceae bacterium]|nr:hypothetical protein [Polyangiaceae bacterium]
MPLDKIIALAGSLLGLLTLAVLVWQTVLLRRSVDAQREAQRPRLHILDIRVEDLRIDTRALFVITIANDGPVASNVDLVVELWFDTRNLMDRFKPLVIAVPAHARIPCAVRSNTFLTEARLKALEERPFVLTVALNVLGQPKSPASTYEYISWEGERPETVPHFTLADMKSGWNTTLEIQPAQMRFTSGNATITTDKKANGGLSSE